jgi:flagellar biosynthesis/type III secretory pathway protein FliH
MSDARQLAWLERSSAEIRAVGWARGDAGAGDAERERAGAETVDASALAAEREARRAAEDDAQRVRAELASVRAAAAEIERAADEAFVRETEARDALAREVEAMATRTRELVDCAEREIMKLALAVAERVVGREVATDPSLVVAWVREAIAGAELGEGVAIYVSTDLAANIPEGAWGDLADRVAVDEELPRDTCEVHDGARVVPCSERARLSLVAGTVGAVDREAA